MVSDRMLDFVSSPLAGLADRLAARVPLGPAERDALIDLPAATAQLPANRQIVADGAASGHAYLVVEGLIGRVQHTRCGDQQITGPFLPGETACLEAIVRPATNPAVHSLAPSTLLVMPHDALRRLERRYPAITRALWAESVLQATIAAEWLLNIGRRRSLERTAHLFCELACRQRADDRRPSLRFALPARQNHLADMLALTPVHLNRTLRLLREEELASLKGRELHIHDWPRLARLADFDPAYLG